MVDAVAINDAFALNMRMGPVFQTTVTPLLGGYEDRNQDWPKAMWRYECELANQAMSVIQAFVIFILGRGGAARSFLLKDPLYHTLTDENIGTGNGSTAAFQIHQLFNDSINPYYRNWYSFTGLVVKVAGVTKTLSTHYTVTDGLVTFTGGNIPTSGQAITVTATTYVRVRFADDYNPIIITNGVWNGAPASTAKFTLMEVPA